MAKPKTYPKSEFVRIANIERKDSVLHQKKDYRGELDGLHFDVYTLKNIATGLTNWTILGKREENTTEKGSGVFARLSKSGGAIRFYIGDQIYVINKDNVLDESRDFIGISKPVPVNE